MFGMNLKSGDEKRVIVMLDGGLAHYGVNSKTKKEKEKYDTVEGKWSYKDGLVEANIKGKTYVGKPNFLTIDFIKSMVSNVNESTEGGEKEAFEISEIAVVNAAKSSSTLQ